MKRTADIAAVRTKSMDSAKFFTGKRSSGSKEDDAANFVALNFSLFASEKLNSSRFFLLTNALSRIIIISSRPSARRDAKPT